MPVPMGSRITKSFKPWATTDRKTFDLGSTIKAVARSTGTSCRMISRMISVSLARSSVELRSFAASSIRWSRADWSSRDFMKSFHHNPGILPGGRNPTAARFVQEFSMKEYSAPRKNFPSFARPYCSTTRIVD